jgi:hypothetical protein
LPEVDHRSSPSKRCTVPLTSCPTRLLVLVVQHVALGLAQLLHEALLDRLRRDAAELAMSNS